MAITTAHGYGRGTHVIAEDDPGLLDGADLLERLRRTFAAPGYRPPALPSVAMRVHELSRRPDVSFPVLVALLEQDAMLAADVLRAARCAVYATRVPPRSLKDAVSRLGLSTVRDLVWQVAVTGRIFRVPGFSKPMEALRRHSVAVAHIARLVSSRTAVGQEYSFLCGLLHDVGLVACFLELASESRSARIDLAEVAPELLRVHEEAAAIVTKQWDLPMDVQLVVANHHDPRVGGFCHPLSSVVCIAEQVAFELGAGLEAVLPGSHDVPDPMILSLALDAVGLSDQQMQVIREDAVATLEKLSTA